MKRFLAITWLALFALSLPLLLSHFGNFQAAFAEAPEGVWGDPHVGIVADTTQSMQLELNALAAAWKEFQVHGPDRGPDPNCHEVPCGPLTATLHLGLFKDSAAYFGNTTDRDTYGDWLAALEASGGGECTDAALQGLLNMAANLPDSETPGSNVLLVTDATPQGNIQQYMYLLDKLLRRGVRVHTVLSGACGGTAADQIGLAYLAGLSGGQTALPISPADFYTHTVINLSMMGTYDVIGTRYGFVTDGLPEIIPLNIDSTITVLGVEDDDPNANCPPWCCLTCTLQMAALESPALDVAPGVQVQLRAPGGMPVGPSTPGFFGLSAFNREYFGVYRCLTCTLSMPAPSAPIPTGTWSVRVSGSGAYAVDIVAETTLHLAYLGRHNMPTGRNSFVRAALIEETGLFEPLTATFRLISADGQQSQPVNLFDDGQHNDGAAGDGLYGGVINPNQPGLWRLAVTGELSDGSSFQRLDPTPIRVQRFRLPEPTGSVALPGSTRQVTFELINDPATRGGTSVTFDLEVFSEQGWTITDTVPLSVTLAPGETVEIAVEVVIPAGATIGAVEETTLVAVPVDDIGAAITAATETAVVAELEVYLPLVISRP